MAYCFCKISSDNELLLKIINKRIENKFDDVSLDKELTFYAEEESIIKFFTNLCSKNEGEELKLLIINEDTGRQRDFENLEGIATESDFSDGYYDEEEFWY